MEPRHDRPDRYVEDRGDLVVGPFLDRPQIERLSKRRSQRIQEFDRSACLEPIDQRTFELGPGNLTEISFDVGSLSTMVVKTAVSDDPEQPSFASRGV